MAPECEAADIHGGRIFRCRSIYLLIIFIAIVLIVIIATTIIMPHNDVHGQFNAFNFQLNGTKDEFHQEMKFTLLEIAKHLTRAHRYARSGKTIIEISEAYKKLTVLLDGIHALDAKSQLEKTLEMHSNIYFNPENTKNVPSLTSDSMLDVCPEVYTNGSYGYPYYFKGFEMLNCGRYNIRPSSQVLTLYFDFTNEIDILKAHQIFEGLNASGYNRFPLVLVVSNNNDIRFIENETKIHSFLRNVSIYNSTRKALDNISTEYILILRDLVHFDWNARLERLVRLISYKVADLVAGSHRTENGQWMAGCYQIGLKNYTLRLVEGYDISYNACMYCEYSSGPFAMRSKLLRQLISHELKGQNQYLDLMLKLRAANYVTMTCPDAMFYTGSIGFQRLTAKVDWLPLVQKWKLNRIVLPDNSDIVFTCKEANMGCYKKKGYIVSLCCLTELNDMLNVAQTLFAANNIKYELNSGSVLALAKLENAFPWERDHDISVLSRNFGAIMKLNEQINSMGYKFILDTKDMMKCIMPIEACIATNERHCGYIAYRGSYWRIEIWGVNCLSSHVIPLLNGMNSTQVRNTNFWVNTRLNPMLYSRNRYGYQILRHVEHWSTLGMATGRSRYTSGKFAKCPEPGFHGCLDNFLPDGNLQFRNVWV